MFDIIKFSLIKQARTTSSLERSVYLTLITSCMCHWIKFLYTKYHPQWDITVNVAPILNQLLSSVFVFVFVFASLFLSLHLCLGSTLSKSVALISLCLCICLCVFVFVQPYLNQSPSSVFQVVWQDGAPGLPSELCTCKKKFQSCVSAKKLGWIPIASKETNYLPLPPNVKNDCSTWLSLGSKMNKKRNWGIHVRLILICVTFFDLLLTFHAVKEAKPVALYFVPHLQQSAPPVKARQPAGESKHTFYFDFCVALPSCKLTVKPALM